MKSGPASGAMMSAALRMPMMASEGQLCRGLREVDWASYRDSRSRPPTRFPLRARMDAEGSPLVARRSRLLYSIAQRSRVVSTPLQKGVSVNTENLKFLS